MNPLEILLTITFFAQSLVIFINYKISQELEAQRDFYKFCCINALNELDIPVTVIGKNVVERYECEKE